ncbi:hypothetical protein CANCADRAFT_74082 [Tortispora caseinolytica NRRL Y-17796]|uniref:Pre-mRNA-processing protein PRP40 n=1 Tax=Tortispora caseinolytica NRRL Y-17796 TaxID=767744 RepID=A0A1E4TIW2_9ASCO|nr:hypothetical protein CANCADRAFT_74082 [Tortispora caseinolytica NRRL Y-17796]
MPWSQFSTPDGRIYYYNDDTKQSSWEKPIELYSAREKALLNTPWREYAAEGGRVYWYNKETGQSVWEFPENAINPEAPPAPRRETSTSRSSFKYLSFEPVTESSPQTFIDALKRGNVDYSFTWPDVVKKIGMEPEFTSVTSAAERRNLFNQYISSLKQEKSKKVEADRESFRDRFLETLRNHSEIQWYSHYSHAAKTYLASDPVFISFGDSRFKHHLFKEFVSKLKQEHDGEIEILKVKQIEDLQELLNQYNIHVYTEESLWDTVYSRIVNEPDYADRFSQLSKLDILSVFESHIQKLEAHYRSVYSETSQQEQLQAAIARSEFMKLLIKLKNDHIITYQTDWKEIYPIVSSDKTYTALCAFPFGSTPLDLFRDVVEESRKEIKTLRDTIFQVLSDSKIDLSKIVRYDDVSSLLASDNRTADYSSTDLQFAFKKAQEKAARVAELAEQNRVANQQAAINRLRRAIRNTPGVSPTDDYESVRAKIENLPEFIALHSDEDRIQAFNAYKSSTIESSKQQKSRFIQNSPSPHLPEDPRARKKIRYED